MNRAFQNVLVSGGAGFIGSNFIRYLLHQADFHGRIINYDLLTYAGNLANLDDVAQQFGQNARYIFVRGDICDREKVEKVFQSYDIDTVVHFAAESHVDRSIHDPSAFIKTNVLGTQVLLDVARQAWQGRQDALFHHISTDEVYGSLGGEGAFREDTPYDPRSPYSASKAAADHLVMAYFHTYGLPITLSNCSNNYGPYQFPEKLIPLMICNMEARKPLPVYGDGKNIRDWLYVEDHNAAVWTIMKNGKAGEKYNIGGETEWENIRLVEELCKTYAALTGVPLAEIMGLITYVKDRPGHDRRYAIDCSKLKNELGWQKAHDFQSGLEKTVQWYIENKLWIESVQSGEYRKWIETNYGQR
jgi:dTDP-glucose 4,6-dehydratase